MVDNIIKTHNSQGKLILYTRQDMDQILEDIYSRQAKCCKLKERKTQTYLVLVIIAQIIEGFDNWKDADDHSKVSEITYYRRFAYILDTLFKYSNIKLYDGETGSASSKVEIEVNRAIFQTNDSKPSYSRKIDLLLKTKELKKPIELSSNEWKRASASADVQLNQQCKNLRVNACILNNLTKFGINETFSMDWIGNSGYFYLLRWLPDHNVYFANNPITIHMPTEPLFLSDIKSVLSVLLKFKACLEENAKEALVIAKRKGKDKNISSTVTINQDSVASVFNTIPSPVLPTPLDDQSFAEPFVFFTPKNCRTKKRRLADEDEEYEDENEDEDNV